MIGAAKVIQVRKRKSPTLQALCLPPGATKPSVCV
jgi:hypothetical protein